MDLLRWFRFLWALGVGWDQVTRVEAQDFCTGQKIVIRNGKAIVIEPDAA
jgi:hypothetical protein